MQRLLSILLLLLSTGMAMAQSGFMRNVSASGLVIEDDQTSIAQIACTIVDQASVGLIIFAEAINNGTDPFVALVQLIDGDEVLLAENDDWRTLPVEEQNIIVDTLRAPARDTDSALSGVAQPGAYCAFAFQVGDEAVGTVNLQITDVSESTLNKNSPPLSVFRANPNPEVEAMIDRAQQGLLPPQP